MHLKKKKKKKKFLQDDKASSAIRRKGSKALCHRAGQMFMVLGASLNGGA